MREATRNVLITFFVALVARLAAAAVLGGDFHFADEVEYADAARRLLSGEGLPATYIRVPAYPAFLALLATPAPGSLLWLRMAQAAIAALGATVTYLLADRWVGRPAALGASTIYALDPLLVVSAGLLYPETTGALLLLCAALLLHDATRRDSVVLAAVTGSLFALLALVRPAALVLVPVGAVWLGLAPTIPPRRRALQVTVLMLACLVVLTPWTWRNYRIYGRLIPVSLVGTSAGGLSRSEIERQGLAGALLDRAAREPLALVSRMAIEFCHFWEFKPSRLLTDDPELREALHRQDPRLSVEPTAPRRVRDIVSVVSFGAELLLAFIGLAVMWRSRRREAILLVALVLAYAFAHSLFVGRLRYRITVLPLLFIMAGAGSAALHAAVRRRRLRG